MSLIKRICSTQYNNVIMVPALEWGRNNEAVARKAYSKRQLPATLDSDTLLVA